MITPLSHQRPRLWTATRQAGTRLRQLATVLTAVISGLLASAAAATAPVTANERASKAPMRRSSSARATAF
jgi:hypothetical protein